MIAITLHDDLLLRVDLEEVLRHLLVLKSGDVTPQRLKPSKTHAIEGCLE